MSESYLVFNEEESKEEPIFINEKFNEKEVDNNIPSNNKVFEKAIEIFELSPEGKYYFMKFKDEVEVKMYKTFTWELENSGTEILNDAIKSTSSFIEKECKINWEEYCFFIKWTKRGIHIVTQNKKTDCLSVVFITNNDNNNFNDDTNFNLKKYNVHKRSFPSMWDNMFKQRVIGFYALHLDDGEILIFQKEDKNIVFAKTDGNSFDRAFERSFGEKIISISSNLNTIFILADSLIKIYYFEILYYNLELVELLTRKLSGKCAKYYDSRRHLVMICLKGKILAFPYKYSFIDYPFEDLPSTVIAKVEKPIVNFFLVENKVMYTSGNTVYWSIYSEINEIEENSKKTTKEILEDFDNKEDKEKNWLRECYIGENIWMKVMKEKERINNNTNNLKSLLEAHLKLIKNIDYRNNLAFFEFESKYYFNKDNKDNSESLLLDYILKDSSSKIQLLVLDSFSSSTLTLKFKNEIAQEFVRITGDIQNSLSFPTILTKVFTGNEGSYNLELKKGLISLIGEMSMANLMMDFYKYFIEMEYWHQHSNFILYIWYKIYQPIEVYILKIENVLIKYSIGMFFLALFFSVCILLRISERIIILTIHLTLFLGETALTLLVAPGLIKTTILKYLKKNISVDSNKASEGTERSV